MLIGGGTPVWREVILLATALVITLGLLLMQIVRLLDAGNDLPPIAMPPLTSQKVHAIGGEASWFGSDNYPPGARRRGEEGRVQMRIGIDEEGRVRACEIEVSSGSRELDQTSCALLRQRGRYEPIMGTDGRAKRVSVKQSVRWVLDSAESPSRPRG